MGRIRSFKPQFLRHELLQDLEVKYPGHYIMLVFMGLWTLCDSKGRFEFKPRTMRNDILPLIPFDFVKTLQILLENYFFLQYTVDDKHYGVIPTFNEHQRIVGIEFYKGERYPAPPDSIIKALPAVPPQKALPPPAPPEVIEALKEPKKKEPEAVKEPPPPKKAKKETPIKEPKPYWQLWVDTWFDFHKENKKEEPSFKGQDPVALENIYLNIKKRTEHRNPDGWTEEFSLMAFKKFLKLAYADKWLKDHFLLKNLEANFDIIIQPRNGTDVKGVNGKIIAADKFPVEKKSSYPHPDKIL